MPNVRRARHRGVRQSHSTVETGEQRGRAATCGVGGGKGADRGEHRTSATGPVDRTQRRNADGSPYVPRSRGLTGVRETPTRGSPSPSKVRAVCGSSARMDLCGGWPERFFRVFRGSSRGDFSGPEVEFSVGRRRAPRSLRPDSRSVTRADRYITRTSGGSAEQVPKMIALGGTAIAPSTHVFMGHKTIRTGSCLPDFGERTSRSRHHPGGGLLFLAGRREPSLREPYGAATRIEGWLTSCGFREGRGRWAACRCVQEFEWAGREVAGLTTSGSRVYDWVDPAWQTEGRGRMTGMLVPKAGQAWHTIIGMVGDAILAVGKSGGSLTYLSGHDPGLARTRF